MMRRPSIGEQELQLLEELARAGPASVAEAVERFGSPRGLARSTVLTMLERLRDKGWVTRRRVEGVYRYASRLGPEELLRGAVERFVERSLGGSLSPFVSYLVERERLTDREVAELEELVSRLRSRRKEG